MRCYLCSYFCSSSLKNLVTHWRIFQSLTPNSVYECTLPQCRRKFSSLNSFKKHFNVNHTSYFQENAHNATTRTELLSIYCSANNSTFNNSSEPAIDETFTSAIINDTLDLSNSLCMILNNDNQVLNDPSIPSTSNSVTHEESFEEIIKFQVQRMIISLYSKPSIPRNIVQCVIDEIHNIIAVPIKIVQDKVEQILIENSVSLNQQN